MSFGITNLGVINQKQAPAIWESDFADFPPNGVLGRLLLALDTATLYVDLTNGASPTRATIAQGLLGNGNGTTVTLQNAGDYQVDLGGDLTANVIINTQGIADTSFVGDLSVFKIRASGRPQLDAKDIPSAENIGATVVVADTTLRFKIGNNSFDVAAETV